MPRLITMLQGLCLAESSTASMYIHKPSPTDHRYIGSQEPLRSHKINEIFESDVPIRDRRDITFGAHPSAWNLLRLSSFS